MNILPLPGTSPSPNLIDGTVVSASAKLPWVSALAVCPTAVGLATPVVLKSWPPIFVADLCTSDFGEGSRCSLVVRASPFDLCRNAVVFAVPDGICDTRLNESVPLAGFRSTCSDKPLSNIMYRIELFPRSIYTVEHVHDYSFQDC